MVKTLGYGFKQEGEELETVLSQYQAGGGLHDDMKGAVEEAAEAISDGTVPRFAKITVFSVQITEHQKAADMIRELVGKKTGRKTG